MAYCEVKNCDNCSIMLPYDPALELTKIYYETERGSSTCYYKDEVVRTYKYFREELEKKNENEL